MFNLGLFCEEFLLNFGLRRGYIIINKIFITKLIIFILPVNLINLLREIYLVSHFNHFFNCLLTFIHKNKESSSININIDIYD